MSKLNRVVRSLTFDHWVGAPIPSRRKPDGVRTQVGSRVRFREHTVGFIWKEWLDIDGDLCEVLCRRLASDETITRAMVDTAAAAFLLAAEWASTSSAAEDIFANDLH